MATDWVNCPICGDCDMECTYEEDVKYIHCVNGACASNGGDNASEFLKKIRNDKVVPVLQKTFSPASQTKLQCLRNSNYAYFVEIKSTEGEYLPKGFADWVNSSLPKHDASYMGDFGGWQTRFIPLYCTTHLTKDESRLIVGFVDSYDRSLFVSRFSTYVIGIFDYE